MTLPGTEFTADVYELEGQWNPTPWVSATSQLQYDNQSEQVGLFARLRWIVTPGSDLYLVYTQNWLHCMDGIDEEECSPLAIANRDFVTLSRGGSVKLSYTYRF